MSSKLVANEIAKLAASACNTLATSCVTVGIFTPIATLFVYLDSGRAREKLPAALLAMCVSVLLGLYLHLTGRRLLWDLTY